MTSSRLPGKVLIESAGKTMLAHHLDRLSHVGVPVIVATTSNDADEPIVAAATDRDVAVFRGSKDDVLSRFVGAAEMADLDVIVRVTSDCPLVDPKLIQRGIAEFLAFGDRFAHVSNVLDRSYPRGFDFEVFSAEALADAARLATEPAEREHVTPYLYANRSGRTTLLSIRRDEDASRYRVTLDTKDDLALIRALLEEHHADELDVEGVISVLDRHPELVALNAHVEQKKLWD